MKPIIIRKRKKKKAVKTVYQKRNEQNRQIKKYIRQLKRMTDEMRLSEIGWFKLEFEYYKQKPIVKKKSKIKQEPEIKEVSIFIK